MDTKFCDIPAGRVAYWRREGTTSVVLFIHSIGTSKRLFFEMAACWDGRDTLLAPDILGHGESSKPKYEYTVEDHADVLVAFLKDQGVTTAHIVGTSLGSRIALDIAARYRDITKSLTLNGCAGWHLESQRMARLRSNSGSLIDENGLPRTVAKTGRRHPRPDDESFLEERNRDLQRAGRWVVSSMWANASYDMMPRLKKVEAPTLVLMGEHDFHLPTVYQVSDAIDGSRLVIHPDAGHLTSFDDPEGFARTVRAFVAEVESA